MSYCTQSELVARFGLTELLRLTDLKKTGRINADEVQLAIQHVDAVIDANLRKVATLPLSTVPDELVGYACDLVRARLYSEAITDRARDLEEQAMAYLTAVRDGKIPLGIAEPSAASPRLVRRIGQSRVDWETF